MLTQVTLHGALAVAAGAAVWLLDVKSPGEAIRAIECQTGRVYRHLLEGDKEGVRYHVLADGEDVAGKPEVLSAPIKHYTTLDFIPVPAGASLGLWEAIAGVVLIIVGAVLIYSGVGAAFAPYVITAGVGLLAGGISALFFGPKAPVTTNTPQVDRGNQGSNASYLFNGPVNTIAQGGPVPVLYGRMIVGSQTISSGLRTTSTVLGGEDAPTDDQYRAALKVALNIGGLDVNRV